MASNTPPSDEPASPENFTEEMASDSQTGGTVQGQRSLQEETKYWSECIKQWFPDLLNTTYFVPPGHFNRMPYKIESIAGLHALILEKPISEAGASQGHSGQGATEKCKTKTSFQPYSSQASTTDQSSHQHSVWTPTDLSMGLLLQSVQDSDVRDDHAMTHLLGPLQEMANCQQEVMMVISELKFSNYLNKLTTDMAGQFLRPSVEGDFDLLIIHRQYGLLVGEVKSVGANRKELGIPEQDFEKGVVKKIRHAARQLKKASDVVQHLVSDLAPGITCHTSLILPNVTTQQLRQFSQENQKKVKKDLCEYLACPDKTDFTEFFLCKEQLSSVPALSSWWQEWKRRNGVQPFMSDDLYQQIVARFVGPASTVEIHCVTPPRVELRTPGQGVAETGRRMTRLVLTPDQADLLTRRPPRVFVTGPPGTGKTVILVLIALEWLRDGHDVYVVSLWPESRAASHLIKYQLEQSLYPNVTSTLGTVHRRQFVLDDDDDINRFMNTLPRWADNDHRHQFNRYNAIDRTVNTLSCLADNGALYLIIDEVPERYRVGIKLKVLCNQLAVRVPHLHLWAASVYHGFRPRVLQEEKLTTALRCPPVIVQKVKQANQIGRCKSVYGYSHTEIPAPTHGPPIIHLIHSPDGHDGHNTTRYVQECEQCGTNLAGELKKLNIGPRPFSSSPSTADSNTSSPLMYRDVFVLYYGHIDGIRRGIDFVQGLLKAGVPVQVFDEDVDVRDMTLGLHDRVTVATYNEVQGLERKVVVLLEYKYPGLIDLLFSASRCTSQLILIEPNSSRDLSVEMANNDDDDDIADDNYKTNEDNTHHLCTKF